MSAFIHTERELNTLGKYFKEELKIDKDLADNIIFNLYQFEVVAVNTRYEENNQLDIKMYQDEEYQSLELISDYDALKLLNSIKYQASDIQSDVLWIKVLNLYEKLVNGILKIKNIQPNYKKHSEYEISNYW
ncbi:hypothetical protein ACWEX2_13935 [Staphylococcus xylosus]|uniref:Uncharacterized protein n=1 Tax=Staphylococcus xylosus TaxID=1288 RepID=A0AAQ0LXF8_STAXY|nr:MULTISPECIES: hypothetical protein [Staphylococcus]RIL87928.1 hypothetical protein BUY32_12400 [Staphylococcus cohnii]RIM90426.1 hypothetical protein BU104_14460 [Staphylococcus xylosus]